MILDKRSALINLGWYPNQDNGFIISSFYCPINSILVKKKTGHPKKLL